MYWRRYESGRERLCENGQHMGLIGPGGDTGDVDPLGVVSVLVDFEIHVVGVMIHDVMLSRV